MPRRRSSPHRFLQARLAPAAVPGGLEHEYLRQAFPLFREQLDAGTLLRADDRFAPDLHVLCDVPAGSVEIRHLAGNAALIAGSVGASYALCALGHKSDNTIAAAIRHAAPPSGTPEECDEEAWLAIASLDAQMAYEGVDAYELYVVGGVQLQAVRAPAPAGRVDSMQWTGKLLHEAGVLQQPGGLRHVRFAAAAVGLSRGDAPSATRPVSVCVFVTAQGVFYVPEN